MSICGSLSAVADSFIVDLYAVSTYFLLPNGLMPTYHYYS